MEDKIVKMIDVDDLLNEIEKISDSSAVLNCHCGNYQIARRAIDLVIEIIESMEIAEIPEETLLHILND